MNRLQKRFAVIKDICPENHVPEIPAICQMLHSSFTGSADPCEDADVWLRYLKECILTWEEDPHPMRGFYDDAVKMLIRATFQERKY